MTRDELKEGLTNEALKYGLHYIVENGRQDAIQGRVGANATKAGQGASYWLGAHHAPHDISAVVDDFWAAIQSGDLEARWVGTKLRLKHSPTDPASNGAATRDLPPVDLRGLADPPERRHGTSDRTGGTYPVRQPENGIVITLAKLLKTEDMTVEYERPVYITDDEGFKLSNYPRFVDAYALDHASGLRWLLEAKKNGDAWAGMDEASGSLRAKGHFLAHDRKMIVCGTEPSEAKKRMYVLSDEYCLWLNPDGSFSTNSTEWLSGAWTA